VNSEIINNTQNTISDFNGIELNFSLKKRHEPIKNYKSSIVFNPPEIVPNFAANYKKEIQTVF
jgi:hypothetical protein